MKAFFSDIRTPLKKETINQQIILSIGFIICGGVLGVVQKWLDGLPINALPSLLQQLDIGNYFGRLAIWILLATAIAVYSSTPIRAAINTFLFLMSMVGGYYLYCHFVSGFLPVTYMMVWIIISFSSIFLGFICWYAKGQGIIAILISGTILGVLFSQAFLITQGIYMTHFLEVITWIIGVLILYRKPKEFAFELGISFVVAIIYQLLIPYYG
ncbi:MAG: hypothetical protein E7231_11100 [Cellulosilyticum sp.]|nr:hypothetical protein [Cellulosilyticum sp.]